MTWPKMLALSLLAVACTEQIVEAITGRGDPSGDRARRKPPAPAPDPAAASLSDTAAFLRRVADEVRRQRERAEATVTTSADPIGTPA